LTADSEKIAWAQVFCEYQRTLAEGLFVFVDARILEMPKGTLKELGIDGTTKTFDKRADLDALVDRLKNHEGVNLMNSPRLLVHPRAQASMSVGDSVSYVADWRLEIVEPGPQSVPVPTIENVFDGTMIECCAVPLDEGVYGLELKFTSSHLVRPIPTKKIRIGSGEGKEVEVGLPELKKIGVDTRVSLADGASLLLGVLSAEEGREVVVTVTLRSQKIGAAAFGDGPR
jgi:type II secretory pathway component GspD/PulD (secretin)